MAKRETHSPTDEKPVAWWQSRLTSLTPINTSLRRPFCVLFLTYIIFFLANNFHIIINFCVTLVTGFEQHTLLRVEQILAHLTDLRYDLVFGDNLDISPPPTHKITSVLFPRYHVFSCKMAHFVLIERQVFEQ